MVTENDPGNAASNPPLPADEIGGQTLGATPLYAKEFDGSAIGTKGAAETVASIAMEPNGSYVAVWTEDAQYTAGGTSNEDIEFRQFNESVDSVGPLVSGYLDPSGQPIAANAQLLQPLQYIVVDFDKSMDVPTVTNLNNWVLEQANGTPLVGGISQIYFGMNELQTLSQLSGTAGYSEFSTASPVGTNQWQAVLVLNGDGNSGGTAPLGAGQWTLVAKNSVLDYAGNPLGRNGWSVNGAPESISINIIKPSGGQTMINGNASDPVDGGSSNGSGGNTVASDGNGDFVAVFDLSSTTGAQAAGVYAKIYENDLYGRERNPDSRRPEPPCGHRPFHRRAVVRRRDPGDQQYDGHPGGRGRKRQRRFRGHLGGGRPRVPGRLERLLPGLQRGGPSPVLGAHHGQLLYRQRAEFSRRGHGRRRRLRDYLAERLRGRRQRLRHLLPALRFPGQCAGRHQRAPGSGLYRHADRQLRAAVAGRGRGRGADHDADHVHRQHRRYRHGHQGCAERRLPRRQRQAAERRRAGDQPDRDRHRVHRRRAAFSSRC